MSSQQHTLGSQPRLLGLGMLGGIWGQEEGIRSPPASSFSLLFPNTPVIWQLVCYRDRLSKLPSPCIFS